MYKQQKDNGNYFKVPNAIFHLGLHRTAIAIYAYLMCIEDRRTYQCIVSYPTIAEALGFAVNTVAKYVRTLEERGLIRTEHTEIVTRDGRKRNGCLKYHILQIQNAIDLYHERQLAELELTTARQKAKAKAKAEKMGIGFIPADGKQSA